MKRFLIILTGICTAAITLPAAAMPIANLSYSATAESVLPVHGHHYGWYHGRGHHYGWWRGRHRGWYH
jgi:hypothetical protein